jgi:hypothetical protein
MSALEPNPKYRFIRKSTRGGKLMLKKLALATAAVGLLMSTASADYYIVQEKATKKCKVVETDRNDLDPDWSGGLQDPIRRREADQDRMCREIARYMF